MEEIINKKAVKSMALVRTERKAEIERGVLNRCQGQHGATEDHLEICCVPKEVF